MSAMDLRSEKNDALASAAIAAVAGAVAYGVKKALADSPGARVDGDMLLPLFDKAAGAAGRWVAESSPDVIRDRLLPRFIEGFTDAAG
jgi:hypothetical protein